MGVQRNRPAQGTGRNYYLFVRFSVFQLKWNNIEKTYKSHQNPSKSWEFFGEFFGNSLWNSLERYLNMEGINLVFCEILSQMRRQSVGQEFIPLQVREASSLHLKRMF